MTSEPDVLWRPSAERISRANLTRFRRYAEESTGRELGTYQELWRWSVEELEDFWRSLARFFELPFSADRVLVRREAEVRGAHWFPGVTLNFAERIFQERPSDDIAVIATDEGGELRTLSWGELHSQVACVASNLARMGVGVGDRVASYMPNVPETLVAFLASASLGATWSSCAPEFGVAAVVDRFRQIAPRVLLAVDGYRYNGRKYDRRGEVAEIQRQLPDLGSTVLLPLFEDHQGDSSLQVAASWHELLEGEADLRFEPVPFGHPLWLLFSSGTTGPPKAIVHGHGGVLLEQLKALSLHFDLGVRDRFFWFSTTGWMMWNTLVSGLQVGATIVMYDGSPTFPDPNALWRMAERTGVTFFGTSAPFLTACMKAGIEPGRDHDLGGIRTIGSTAAPLPPEGFRWVYRHVGEDLLLASTSGGTDVCTSLVTSCPTLPVRAGEIQVRALGASVEAFDERGHAVVDQVGELVVTEPMPSMPLALWNDPDGNRLRSSYFEQFSGVWTHGDWIKITPGGGCVVYGRSDATLNRGGVRMGTSEFYRVVERLPYVHDSLVVQPTLVAGPTLLLFVVLAPGGPQADSAKEEICDALLKELSPRHLPDEIRVIESVPRTLNGKKLEVPVKRILEGVPIEAALSLESVANPNALEPFLELAIDPTP